MSLESTPWPSFRYKVAIIVSYSLFFILEIDGSSVVKDKSYEEKEQDKT